MKSKTWSPVDYDDAAVIAKEAELEMLNRLDFMSLQPKCILDLGCGTGHASLCLQAKYKEACVIAIDIDMKMANYTKNESRSSSVVCADAAQLPLANESCDVIFANFLLPWHTDFSALLAECQRVLREDGVIMFSCLGPDTLRELPHYLDVDQKQTNALQLPLLLDMHDVGDALVKAKFLEPVLDVVSIQTVHRKSEKLERDLSASMLVIGEIEGQVRQNTDTDDTLELTYEVIFAHAFAPAKNSIAADEDGVAHVSLSHFRRMLMSHKS